MEPFESTHFPCVFDIYVLIYQSIVPNKVDKNCFLHTHCWQRRPLWWAKLFCSYPGVKLDPSAQVHVVGCPPEPQRFLPMSMTLLMFDYMMIQANKEIVFTKFSTDKISLTGFHRWSALWGNLHSAQCSCQPAGGKGGKPWEDNISCWSVNFACLEQNSIFICFGTGNFGLWIPSWQPLTQCKLNKMKQVGLDTVSLWTWYEL